MNVRRQPGDSRDNHIQGNSITGGPCSAPQETREISMGGLALHLLIFQHVLLAQKGCVLCQRRGRGKISTDGLGRIQVMRPIKNGGFVGR